MVRIGGAYSKEGNILDFNEEAEGALLGICACASVPSHAFYTLNTCLLHQIDIYIFKYYNEIHMF